MRLLVIRSMIVLVFLLFNELASGQTSTPNVKTSSPAASARPINPLLLPPPKLTNTSASVPTSNFRQKTDFENLSQRDPFKLPEYIIIKIRQKLASSLGPVTADDAGIDPVRRWPLGSYQLVGIIWDVKKPKAMFQDRMNSIHVLLINDFIGNARGVITRIQNGSVTVLEGKIPQVIRLKK